MGRAFKNPAMFERMEDDLLLEIGLDITPKYIGDDLVFLLGLTDAGAKQVLNGGKDGGASPFYSLEKWSPSLCTGFRLTWVQCWGIPLQAWDTKHIKKILVAMGETTYVEAHNKPQVAKHLANLSIDWITQGCILGWLGSKRRKEGEKKL